MIKENRGDKIAEKKISKKIKSKRERDLAASKSKACKGVNNSHCPYCGYRVRSTGHFRGKHHNS